jgi:hypothetical protein
MLAGLADVIVEVLAARTRHSLMPGTAMTRCERLSPNRAGDPRHARQH